MNKSDTRTIKQVLAEYNKRLLERDLRTMKAIDESKEN